MTSARPQTSLLGDNLNQHVIIAQALIEILAKERAALMIQDVETLVEVNHAKSTSAEQLHQLGISLKKMCHGAEGKAVESFICRQINGLELLARWQQLLQLADRCQKANLENGVLLQERQQRVRASLQMIRQAPRPLYGRAGSMNQDTGKHALAWV